MSEGLRAHRRGDLQRALDAYDACLRSDPACIDARIAAGSAHAQLGRAREALGALESAKRLLRERERDGTAPGEALGRAWRDVGLGLATLGELAAAGGALRRAVVVDGELVGAWLHLARVELELGARDAAIAAAKRATALRPDNASTYLELARVAFLHDDRTETSSALRAAVKLAHPSPLARLWSLALLGVHAQSSAATSHDEVRRLADLDELARREPTLAAEVDAARYLLRRMSTARWFSGSRETLRYAADAAEAGTTVELGVRHGTSLRWLRECRSGALHGFDSFEGLPTPWSGTPTGRFTTAGQTPSGVGCQLWVGTFDEQLPKFVERHPERVALLHVDSDLYESAWSGLTRLAGLLEPGSVIVFDEYFGHRSWRSDEFAAFAHARERYGWSYEYLAANPFTGQAVVRLLGG